MRVEYDPSVDTLYVHLSDEPQAYTEDLSAGREYERGVDYAEDGTVVGVDFVNASRGVDLRGSRALLRWPGHLSGSGDPRATVVIPSGPTPPVCGPSLPPSAHPRP